MGSGLGQADVYSGDYDIQLFDPHMVNKYKLKSLKLGAFVAILNTDHRYGRIYRTKYVSIGVVVHSDSSIAGHGPGVMTVITGPDSKLIPVIGPKAHLAEIFIKKQKK